MGHHRRPHPSAARQKGVVLILALLFALAILILGGSAVRTVLMAEKMGGNMRNQSLSFQAAEAAILAAEAHLSTTLALSRTVGSGTGTGAGDYGTSAITSTSSTSDGRVLGRLHLEQDQRHGGERERERGRPHGLLRDRGPGHARPRQRVDGDRGLPCHSLRRRRLRRGRHAAADHVHALRRATQDP